jgi:two-component system, cell cycle sensor histidine kinase and response regulator CckA
MYRSASDGRILYANPALHRMLGYSRRELIGKLLDTDIYADPTARARCVAKWAPLGRIDGAEVVWKHKDGTLLTVQLHGTAVMTPEGKRMEVWVTDVTALRTADEELASTASILDLVLQQMPAVYWMVDRDLRVLRTGGAVEQLLGYPRDRFIGRTLYEAHREEPGSADPIAIHRRALAGETVAFENEYVGKHMSNTVGPYRDASGEIIGAIGTCIDVTAARTLERRMVDAQRAESLGVLAGGLAHDFNNLLVGVLGNAEMALREIPRGGPGRTAVESVRDAGLRAAELTNQLLAYAGRGGAGNMRVHPADLIEELLRITAPTFPANLQLDVDVPANLALRGDPSQVRQVLLNLIANARDALGDRGGAIRITAVSYRHDGTADPDDVLTAPAGNYIAIEVADDGPGMDAETRRHVFEPFFTTKQTGHGLGLAAVLGIVRAHGGGLELTSVPGQGARFCVYWPAAATMPMRAMSEPPATALTVLIIDDEDLVRDVIARMIEDLGYAAVTARDGVTGLDLIERGPIDAVLVDMTMPVMSGDEVIAALRKRHPNLPVVLCSGYDRASRGPVTADAYLPKPFRIEVLERTLAKLLPLRSV